MDRVYKFVMKAALIFILTTTTAVALSAAPQQTNKPDAPAVPKPGVNVNASAQQEFKTRLDQYLALRRKAMGEGSAPAPKQSNKPAEINAAEDRVAVAIRAARADAKQGDIFTPDVQAAFRKLLAPELKGEDGAHAKDVLKDDAPTGVPLKVNGKYPDGQSFPSVPSKLLFNLPKLPMEVEYRIIGKNLILRDTSADIIVDYMMNAIK
jgi:hypothetical protein